MVTLSLTKDINISSLLGPNILHCVLVQKLSVLTTRSFPLTDSWFIYPFTSKQLASRDSSVGIAMSYGLDVQSSIPGREDFLFSTATRPALGPTQPLIQWVLEALCPGVQQP
jgi:hypothetical protein